MKKLYIIACLLIIARIAYAGPSGYELHKSLTLNGSTTDDFTGAIGIIASPFSNSVEEGSWTINSKVYNYRRTHTLTEQTGAALIDYPCMIETDLIWLRNAGYMDSESTGNDVEFAFGTATSGLPYYKGDNAYTGNTADRQIRFVLISMDANETDSLHEYFDPDITAESSNSDDPSDILDTYTYSERVGAASDDFYEGTTGSCVYADNAAVLAGNWIGAGGSYDSGFRFDNIELPNNYYGQSIFTMGPCYITFTSFDSQSSTGILTNLYGSNVDDGATFTSCTKTALTDWSVAWDSIESWVAGSEYNSADIRLIIWELATRQNWASDNAMVIYWMDDGSPNTTIRQAESYTSDSAKAPQLNITAYLHPDYEDRPIVNSPRLQTVDLYFDEECENFPYDVVFTPHGSNTPYSFVDIPETRRTGKNIAMEYVIDVTGTIPQDGELIIDAWYKNSSVTDWSATHSGEDALSFHTEYDFGTVGMTVVSGTWSAEDQQIPLYKGGDFAWTRPIVPLVVDDTVYMYTDTAYYWSNLFRSFGGLGRMFVLWRYPSYTGLLTAPVGDYTWLMDYKEQPRDLTDIYYGISENFNLLQISYPCSAQTADGTTYWRAMTGSNSSLKSSCNLESSTDGITWTAYSENPIVSQGDTGWSPYISSWYLYWDADKTRWVVYQHELGSGVRCGTISGTDPTSTLNYVGVTWLPTYYTEELSIIKNGSTYAIYGSDISGSGANSRQRICYGTSSSATSGFSNTSSPTYITTDYYEFSYNQGMLKPFYDGSDWYATYLTQPRTAGGWSYTDVDNQVGLMKMTTFPNVWEPQDIAKMLYSAGGARDVIIIDGGSYSDFQVRVPILLKYEQENAGIVFRYIDSSNYYYAIFDRSEDEIQLYKYVSGTPALLESEDLGFTMNESGTAYHEAVYCYGSSIKIGISQYGDQFETLITTTDASLSNTGNVGLIGLSSEFYSNNLMVSDYIDPMPTIMPGDATVSFTPKCFPMF